MADWIILDKTTGIGSDEVTITVSSYSELVERLKNLVFTTTDNKASDTCVVRQFAQSRYLLVEPSTVIAPYTGGEVEVRVIASEPWTVASVPSWASCNATGGGAGTKTVRFTVKPNTGNERMWNVYFLATEGLEATLELKQAKYSEGGIVPPEINPDDCEGGSFTVRITGDGCWSFKKDEPSPSPICDDALVWGTYVSTTITGRTNNILIHDEEGGYYDGKYYTPTVDGVNWALCSYSGGTIISTLNMFSNEPVLNPNKKYSTINFSKYFDLSHATSISQMFINCSKVQTLDLSSFNTSNVTNMAGVFQECYNLKSVNLSGLETSKVNTMEKLFAACSSLSSLDLSSFNTSKVEIMTDMFVDCFALESIDLSGFDTSNTRVFTRMFRGSGLKKAYFPSFVTTAARSMNYMFSSCGNLTEADLSGFDTSEVRNFDYMFYNSDKLETIDISNFKFNTFTSSLGDVTTAHYVDMFSGCDSLTTVKVINCNSATQQKILAQLKKDLSSYTWTLSGGIITRS